MAIIGKKEWDAFVSDMDRGYSESTSGGQLHEFKNRVHALIPTAIITEYDMTIINNDTVRVCNVRYGEYAMEKFFKLPLLSPVRKS